MKKKQIIILSISIFILAVLSVCVYKFSDIFSKEVIAEPIDEKHDSLRIKMVGDDLIHNSIYFAAKTDDGYNFDMLFENVKEDIEEADIAIINQETILVSNPNRYSSYPTFGSPTQVGDAIVKAGFDVVLHATNHTMDKGVSGIEDTLNFWKTNYPDMPVLGIHESNEESDIYYLEKNNIKIAFINYTYGLNGLQIPKGKEYMVDVLGNDEELIGILKEAKENSDIVIPILHIGTEYVYTPTSYHKKYVNLCIDNGASVVLCAHPHVLEPVETVITEEGNKGLVYYSLGNFVSNQKQVATLLGGMADFTIERNDEGKVEVKYYELIPLVTHYTDNYYTTYKLTDYTNELAKEHKISRTTNFSVEKLWELYYKIISLSEEV